MPVLYTLFCWLEFAMNKKNIVLYILVMFLKNKDTIFKMHRHDKKKIILNESNGLNVRDLFP